MRNLPTEIAKIVISVNIISEGGVNNEYSNTFIIDTEGGRGAVTVIVDQNCDFTIKV